MSTLLLDASVWLAALDSDDARHAPARELLANPSSALAALDLTLYEVANVAVTRWRSPGDADRLATLISTACPDTLVRIDEELVARSAALAAEHDLTVYDASYVLVAREQRWTLVSTDLRDLVKPGHAIAPDAAL